jgi:hypothetical protein
MKFLRDGDASELAADFGFDVGMFERAFGSRLSIMAYRLQHTLRDFASHGLDHAGIVRGAAIDECCGHDQKNRRSANRRDQNSSFHHFFSDTLGTHRFQRARRMSYSMRWIATSTLEAMRTQGTLIPCVTP